MSLIEAVGAGRDFILGQNIVTAVRKVSLTLEPGHSLGIVGVSGAGKSTLLHMLGGLEKPSRGDIYYQGESLYAASAAWLDQYRLKAVGFVFQFHYLIEELDAVENVALPLRIQRVANKSARERAAQLLAEVGLGDRLQHRPAQLSGGEQQRVSLARALVHNPGLLLADEPTGNLDAATGEAVADLLLAACRTRNMGLVVTTHNRQLAARLDAQCEMRDGLILTPEPHP